jgi:thiol-disulfide isomerase/thioredoxin
MIWGLILNEAHSQVQSVPVYNFPALQQVIDADNDTTYVINFWATWCKPCVEEMPYFEQLHEKYNGGKVKVLLVSLDFRSQLEKRVIPFVEKRNLQPQVVLLDAGNPNKWIDLVDPSWSGAIPATLFIHGKNRRFVEDSFHDLESLETIVNSLIKS